LIFFTFIPLFSADNEDMKRISVALVAGLFITALCAAQNYPAADGSNFRQEGIASWYGAEFDGRPTASGELFNSSQYTAAHPTLPFGTLLTVSNLNNGRKVNVRVNDRGPFVSSRIIDLSRAAAELLDMVSAGTAPVLVESLGSHSQGNNPAYLAETNAQAMSEGGYSNANSQIVAPPYPAPAYQPPAYQAPAQQPVDPVVIQVQPPQQQITQYFQQPTQQVPPPQPVQAQQQPARQQIQPVQQILPVQQVIQPMQPITQLPAPVQQQPPAQPAQPAAQPVVSAPAAPQQVQPLQINIPIEVRPMITPAAEKAAAPQPATTAPPPTPAVAIAPPAAPGITAVAPATIPIPTASPAVKPNKIYRVQIGSYKEARNALAVFERLKDAGLNPVYERNGDYFRVVLSGIPSEEINGVYQKLGTAGFSDPLLREER
jgi:rare lipoprotein A